MQKEVIITLMPLGKKLVVRQGIPLMDVLHEYGVEFPCGARGTCGRCRIKVLSGRAPADAAQQKKLTALGLDETWRLACYCRADSDMTIEIAQFENIILADNTSFSFNPRAGFGIAVDVGTTTLVAQLLNLETGHVLDAVPALNPQVKYGADLISRIQSGLEGNQNKIQALIRNRIGEMIQRMLEKNPVPVSRVVMVGNTVMQHLFCGLDVRPLSFYPFESPELGVQRFAPRQLSWALPPEAEIMFLPSIGSFVGSDILAGIAAARLKESDRYNILIDLGTNGEIVLGNSGGILCASTAAGPAFEGAKISQGMRAVTGAISSLKAENDRLVAHVIGNVPAKGICGSGLIDAMAVLLQQEKIGVFGEINSGLNNIKLAPGIFLTQQDIREFQLAKAAIAAGLQILLNKAGVTFNEVEKIYIAGGFGNFINSANLIHTGLIETTEEKIVKMGNTALIGAKMFLFEEEQSIQKLMQNTRHINLEGDPDFQDIYVEKMMLY